MATYIQYPKYPDKGYAFRKDGRYFVLAERHKSRDMMGVYNCSGGYKLVRVCINTSSGFISNSMQHFSLPTTSLSSISLSPNGNHVAVWESAGEVIIFFVGPWTCLT